MEGVELHNMKVIYCWCKGCTHNKRGQCSLESINVSGAGICTDKIVPESWGGHEVKKNERK